GIDDLAGLRLLTVDHAAAVAGPVDVAFVIDRRADVGALAQTPDHVRLRHVSLAARLDRQRRAPAADRVDDAVVRDHARTDVAVPAVRAPQLLAGIGVDAEHAILHTDDQLLRLLRRRHQDRRVPGGADAGRAPHLLAGRLVERDQGA